MKVRSIKHTKKRMRPIYPAILTKQAIKDYYMAKRLHEIILLLREQSGQSRVGKIPGRPILPTWVANQNTGFTSSFPFMEPAI